MSKPVIEAEKEYLSVLELCVYAGLGKSTIWRLLSDPIDPIPSCVIGKRRLISKTRYRAWADRHQPESQADVRAMVDDVMKAVGR